MQFIEYASLLYFVVDTDSIIVYSLPDLHYWFVGSVESGLYALHTISHSIYEAFVS